MTPVFTIPIAGLVTGIIGILFGIPALRLAGVSLALATFALAVSLPTVAKRFDDVTGGGGGIGLPLPETPFGWDISTRHWLYYEAWVTAGILFVVAWLMVRGRIGRAWRSIRDGEVAAASSGVSPALYKTLAFGVSSFYAGVAGALLVIEVSFVNPDTFPLSLSILLLASVVIGGLGSLTGVIFGALAARVPAHLLAGPAAPAVRVLDPGAVGRLRRVSDRDHVPAPRRGRRAVPARRRPPDRAAGSRGRHDGPAARRGALPGAVPSERPTCKPVNVRSDGDGDRDTQEDPERARRRERRREELLDAADRVIQRRGTASRWTRSRRRRASPSRSSTGTSATRTVCTRRSRSATSTSSSSAPAPAAEADEPRARLAATIDAYLPTSSVEPERYRFLLARPSSRGPSPLVAEFRRASTSATARSRRPRSLRRAGLDPGFAEPWAHCVSGMIRAAGDLVARDAARCRAPGSSST